MSPSYLLVVALIGISIFSMEIYHGFVLLIVQAQAVSPAWLEWKISIGNLLAVGVTIGGATPLYLVLKRIASILAVFHEEHDIMWEDLNIRKGWDWRRPMGRTNGGPRGRSQSEQEADVKARAASAGPN